MRTETAISLIGVTMEALRHREICLKTMDKEAPVELLASALEELDAAGRNTSEIRTWFSDHGLRLPAQSAQPSYHRRSNNQVSAEVEVLIRELLHKRWSRSAIARHLRINRRVVIRVAREAQSAQKRNETNLK